MALMDRFDSKYVVPVAWLEELVQDLSEHSVLSIQIKSQRSTTTHTSTRQKEPAWKITPAAKTSGTKCAFANTPTPGWLFWR